MLPSFLVVDELKSGSLVPVLTDFLQAEHAINAIYPHRHHLSAKVRSFLDLLVAHFRANPSWIEPGSPEASNRGPPGNVREWYDRPARAMAAAAQLGKRSERVSFRSKDRRAGRA
jgi:hypothetical protein